MRFKPKNHHRQSIRLPGYDYSQAGAYFITICSRDREGIFGEMVDEKIRLNTNGFIVQEEWHKTPQIRPAVALDAFVIMPNHIHGIILIKDCRGSAVGARSIVPLQRVPLPQREQFGQPTANSIPTIIRGFKAIVTKRINEIRYRGKTQENNVGARSIVPLHAHIPIWQRNFYEHIIRDEKDFEKIREYIENNPLRWLEDENHPANMKT